MNIHVKQNCTNETECQTYAFCYVAFFVCYGVVDDNVAVLLPLAREYQIDDLTKRCEQFLLCRESSVRSLVLAEEFSLRTLEKKCLDYVNRLLWL